MRILVSAPPGLGHFLPLVPLVWALRSAGNDVLVAATGPALTAAGRAGLSTTDTARDVDLVAIFRSYMTGISSAAPADPVGATIELFARVSAGTTDGVMHAAAAWRPDLVVHSAYDGNGPLAAALLSVPAVHHGLGLGLKPAHALLMRELMASTRERLGLSVPECPAAVVDPCPLSLRSPADLPGWSVRYVPYSGGGSLPDWLLEPPSRTRVCVTLGSVLPRMTDVSVLRQVLQATAELPVEVVLALGDADASGLASLPANVRRTAWVPLSHLVPTCSAVIHHGGAGTTFAAFAAAVPQLVLPHAGDQHAYAEAVERCGAGACLPPEGLDAERIGTVLRGLLGGPEVQRAAREMRQEIEAQPPPADLVHRLTALAGGH